MSKKTSNVNWIIVTYIISTILTVTGWLILINGLSSNPSGYIIMAVGILIALSMAAYLCIRSKKMSGSLVIGVILLIATLLILWDLYVVEIDANEGNFSIENGFLLDGINMVIYTYAGPTLFIGGIILLIIHAMGQGKNQIKGR